MILCLCGDQRAYIFIVTVTSKFIPLSDKSSLNFEAKERFAIFLFVTQSNRFISKAKRMKGMWSWELGEKKRKNKRNYEGESGGGSRWMEGKWRETSPPSTFAGSKILEILHYFSSQYP